ncbi:MAG: hypothetical protein HY901_12555, partial [Deltaproteobacteria bacterium]|nr:hypothetical protein [Deltaproteobacteria bacterium]
AVRPSRAGEVPARQADYVAIVGEGLSSALQPLLAKRQADGRKVASVPVEALYDKFGHGHHGPQAIRAFLAQLSPPPRDVLLVGKPSLDPHDYLGTGVPDLVPTPLVVSGDLRIASPADALLVTGPDERTPFAAIGRLPVLTEQELAAWVAKILEYERSSAGPSGLAVFAADDSDPNTGLNDPFFQDSSEALADSMASSFQPVKVYLPQQGKADLLAALARGPDLVSYHGHGGGLNWAPRLLEASDVPALPAARPFFLVTVDCWDGMFAMPTFAPMAQALAQAPQGGAIAAFSPGGLVDKAHDPLLDEIIYAHLSNPAVLTAGEVARRSHAQLSLLVGPAKDLVFVYNLIGDPATRLPFR